MKSIAWAIIVAGYLIALGICLAPKQRQPTPEEHSTFFVLIAGFLISLAF